MKVFRGNVFVILFGTDSLIKFFGLLFIIVPGMLYDLTLFAPVYLLLRSQRRHPPPDRLGLYLHYNTLLVWIQSVRTP